MSKKLNDFKVKAPQIDGCHVCVPLQVGVKSLVRLIEIPGNWSTESRGNFSTVGLGVSTQD